MMNELSPFYRAVDRPEAIAAQCRQRNLPVVGYLCSYAPEELIFAAGCHPMRIFSSKTPVSLADNLLQVYCCSQIRGILEDGLTGRLDHLDGIVFPHTCDSIQRLSDIWRMNLKPAFFADVIMPAKLTTASAMAYMKQVLEQFKHDLETYTGNRITKTAMGDAFLLFNRIRASLNQISNLSSQTPGRISGKDLFTVIKASAIMERNLLATALEDLEKALANAPVPASSPRRILLSGPVCDIPQLYTMIEDAGGVVAGDDQCIGQRWFEGLIPDPEHIPPMDGLAARYMDRMVCPAKHKGVTRRAETLISMTRKKKADGVIFALLKFCDPHAFDFPDLKKALDREKIPSLRLEMEDQQINSGQMVTRLETFIQMI